ncbi:MAG: hypothetical protein ABWZ52_00410 [Acidimicrobiales bacterium]
MVDVRAKVGDAKDKAHQAKARFDALRERRPIVDYLVTLADRDSEAHGSVLGSAAALRLFLFLIPASLVFISAMQLLNLSGPINDSVEDAYTTGDIAQAVDGGSFLRTLGLLLFGIVLTLWAGRSLGRVLAATSVAAWRMPPHAAKVGVVASAALSGVVFVEVVVATIANGIRDFGGLPAWTLSYGTLVATSGVAWFFVLLVLPRGVSDPGALLPGAIAMGVVQATAQVILHGYAENKIARTTDTYGDMATTIAVLGNLFILGRIMTASFSVSAVTYERFGSLSQLLFSLPGVRRLPRRYPKLAEYFSLDVEGTEAPPPAPTPT